MAGGGKVCESSCCNPSFLVHFLDMLIQSLVILSSFSFMQTCLHDLINCLGGGRTSLQLP